MEKLIGGATILLALLLVAATSDAVADEVDSSIRLTSDGKGLAKQVRPWTCCDNVTTLPRNPPLYLCRDRLDDDCDDASKHCYEDQDTHDHYYCLDLVTDRGPRCTEEDNGNNHVFNGVAADHNGVMPVAKEETKVEEEEERPPWRCCVRIYCKKRWPGPVTTCQCKDKVKRCESGCKSCEEVDGGKVCNDWYQGDPDTTCY